jgi:hypothetical protein
MKKAYELILRDGLLRYSNGTLVISGRQFEKHGTSTDTVDLFHINSALALSQTGFTFKDTVGNSVATIQSNRIDSVRVTDTADGNVSIVFTVFRADNSTTYPAHILLEDGVLQTATSIFEAEELIVADYTEFALDNSQIEPYTPTPLATNDEVLDALEEEVEGIGKILDTNRKELNDVKSATQRELENVNTRVDNLNTAIGEEADNLAEKIANNKAQIDKADEFLSGSNAVGLISATDGLADFVNSKMKIEDEIDLSTYMPMNADIGGQPFKIYTGVVMPSGLSKRHIKVTAEESDVVMSVKYVMDTVTGFVKSISFVGSKANVRLAGDTDYPQRTRATATYTPKVEILRPLTDAEKYSFTVKSDIDNDGNTEDSVIGEDS